MAGMADRILRGALAGLIALMLTGCEASNPATNHATNGPGEVCSMAAPPLSTLAAARGKLIGTAYRSTFTADDQCYQRVATAEFGSLTTEIGTLMNTVEPSPGIFDFVEADAVAALAEQSHLDFQIHALVWDPLDQPQWSIVPTAVRDLPRAERHRLMVDTVTAVMARYAGEASTVTVVNEAFDQMGHLQPNTWWDTTGDDRYVFDAFRAARLANPAAVLLYNDHSAETHSDKSDAIYSLVKRLRAATVTVVVGGKARTVPLIDGIGFQGHMLGGKDQQPVTADMASNLQRFADLGLTIRFTELDVSIPVRNGVADPADLERQRRVYQTMTELCLHQPKCTGLTLWGFTDKRSWITDYPESFSGYGAATPLTPTYERKPAWLGIADALRGT